ncbi:MAG: methylmalonyl-CoA mutase family protein [Candidatus Methylacidiphilales bacterium]
MNSASTTPREPLLSTFPASTYEDWKQAANSLLKGASFEKSLITPTYEGIDLQPLYVRSSSPRTDVADQGISMLRSARKTGYLTQRWKVSQELPYSTPKEFNAAAVPDLQRGQDELNIVLDLAVLSGLDPDQSSSGRVGACGLSLANLQDLETALYSLSLKDTSLYFQSGVSSLQLTALLGALARKRGLQLDDLHGCMGTDPFGVLIWNGQLPISIEQAYHDMAALTSFARQHMPHMATMEVNTNAYHNSGAHASDELAFAIATGTEYLRALLTRGCDLTTVLKHLRFSMAVGGNFFMETAKFRALRMLWLRVIQAFDPSFSEIPFHLHARTGLWNKTVHDPYVNMLRTTTEAFSAVLGGCDSLHVGPFDEIIRTPDTFSRRIARNTHLILAEECDLTRTIDPAGGSWCIETLTHQLCQSAWKTFQEIESAGGMWSALQAGLPQAKVNATREKRMAHLFRRRDLIVGTNIYPNPDEKPLEVRLPDYTKLQRVRGEEIAQLRESSTGTIHQNTIEALNQLLHATPERIVPSAIQAAEAGATLGELSRTLWSKSSEPASITPLTITRASAPFEKLRLASQSIAPILQANIGPSRNYRMRADWTSGFFQVGGFRILNDRDFSTHEEVLDAVRSTGAGAVVITSTDDAYRSQVTALATALKQLNPSPLVLVAGAPGEQENEWRTAGVDDFIHVRVNCYEFLLSLQEKLSAHCPSSNRNR